jgi:hypothetical protein
MRQLQHLRPDLLELLRRQLVRLGHDHEIGGGELILEQLAQRAIVIQVGIVAPLLLHLRRIIRELPGQHRGAVHQRHHCVDRATLPDFRPLEGLHERLGQREAARLDQDVIDAVAPLDQRLEHRHELLLHGATQAAVGELVERHRCARVLVTAHAALAQQIAVDADLAKFVDDDRQPAPFGVAEQVAKQRGLSAPEKSGDDGGRQFFHGSWS